MTNVETQVGMGSRFFPAVQVVSADLGGEMALLDPERGTYFSLNEVGARIWELLGKSFSVEAIRDQLWEEFDVNREECEEDLLRLLAELQRRGLLRVEEKTHA